MEGVKKFAWRQRDGLAELNRYESDGKVGDVVQDARDSLAESIGEKRRERDQLRKESETLSAKVKGFVGVSGSSEELSNAADELHTKLPSELMSGQYKIKREREGLINNTLRETVYDPLNELGYADTGSAVEKLEAIDVENLATLMASKEMGERAKESFNQRIEHGHKELLQNIGPLAIDLVEQFFKTGDFEEAFRLLTSNEKLPFLFQHVTEEQRQKIVNYLEQYPTKLAEQVQESPELFKLCFKYGSEITADVFRGVLDNLVISKEEDLSQYFICISKYLKGYRLTSNPVVAVAKEHVDRVLSDFFGIGFEDVADAWNFEDWAQVSISFEVMKAVENSHEGGVAFLRKNYGIRDFIRYPQEILLSQIEDEDKKQPYGIIVMPTSDYNDAFNNYSDAYRQLYESVSGKHGIKVMEVNDLWELSRRLLKLDEKYGDEHKISFAIIGGHGSPDSIELGDPRGLQKGSHIVHIEDVSQSSFRNASKFFDKNIDIMLMSCSTGVEGGMAEVASRATETRIQAPIVDTSASRNHSLRAVYSGDKVFLDFNDGLPHLYKKYDSGELVNE